MSVNNAFGCVAGYVLYDCGKVTGSDEQFGCIKRYFTLETGIYDVHRIANEEKLVPRNWMTRDGSYVTEDFIDYIKPLIQGDYQPIMVNGLPRHLVLNMKKKR